MNPAKQPRLSLIAAATPSGGIGINGKLPWKLPTDMTYFERVTTHLDRIDSEHLNVVIMGRKTWDSVPPKHRPFKDRISVVLSRNRDFRSTTHDPQRKVYCFQSLDDAIRFFAPPPSSASPHDAAPPYSSLWIIGGTSIYSDAMRHPNGFRIFLTRVYMDVECDAFFENPDPSRWMLASNTVLKRLVGHLEDVHEGRTSENGIEYEFLLYERVENVVGADTCDAR
ncbi:dihydrofolate reductase [Synchytrium endobioticum]|uniref:Dihydrofolate reductase n=1 Tax=Synchytrium endobioticum TaxID=286115 RepID=A0A507CYR1_9FUNG|nr:dihydrofolate reductase [Synchytrium endobioticum]TPX44201.1 dihydrofolate reductase [Synchytrium endobioticum]